MSGDDSSKAVKIEDIWLDFGLPLEELKQKVRLGDVAVLEQPVLQIGDKLVSKALPEGDVNWKREMLATPSAPKSKPKEVK